MYKSKIGVFRAIGLGVVWLTLSSTLQGDDWNRFRGTNGSGISEDENVPTTWSSDENVRWKTELPGPGFSSPIVIGDKVCVTCYSGYGLSRDDPGSIDNLKRHLVCLGRGNGDVLWTATVDAVLPEDPFSGPGVPTHGYASHTPTSDGERIYVFFGKSGVLAYDFYGNQIWKTSVGKGSDPRAWGSAVSLVLHENLLIVNASAESTALIALNKVDGEEVWRSEADGITQTWGTPIMVDGSAGRELVLSVPGEVWGLNPSTGRLKWFAAGSEASGMATSLVLDEGMVYCVGGMMGGNSVAVKTGGKGDVTETHVVWRGRGYAQFGTAVIHQGHLYGANESGIVFCVNAATGELVYQNRLATGEDFAESVPGDRAGGAGMGGRRQGGGRGMGERSYGSALLIDQQIYYTDQGGLTYVFAANPQEFELLAKNQLDSPGGGFNATPAVSDGQLFIRSNQHLYCIGKP